MTTDNASDQTTNLASLDAALDVLDPTITKVLWAAMLSMVHDVHTAQDNLRESDWSVADQVYDSIYARIGGSENV